MWEREQLCELHQESPLWFCVHSEAPAGWNIIFHATLKWVESVFVSLMPLLTNCELQVLQGGEYSLMISKSKMLPSLSHISFSFCWLSSLLDLQINYWNFCVCHHFIPNAYPLVYLSLMIVTEHRYTLIHLSDHHSCFNYIFKEHTF